jgi:hypothetical protein
VVNSRLGHVSDISSLPFPPFLPFSCSDIILYDHQPFTIFKLIVNGEFSVSLVSSCRL